MFKRFRKVNCPYCNQALDETPKRKKKCPHCGEPIHVKKRFKETEKSLITAEEAKDIDRQWREYHKHQEFQRKLDRYDIPEKDFNQRKAQMEKKAGQKINDRTILKSFHTEKLQAAFEANDFHAMKMLYLEQAMVWYEEGADFRKLLEEVSKAELRSLKYSEFPEIYKGVRILTAGDRSCEACQKLEGMAFTIEEALSVMTLPFGGCTFELIDGKPGWCRCEYLPILDEL